MKIYVVVYQDYEGFNNIVGASLNKEKAEKIVEIYKRENDSINDKGLYVREVEENEYDGMIYRGEKPYRVRVSGDKIKVERCNLISFYKKGLYVIPTCGTKPEYVIQVTAENEAEARMRAEEYLEQGGKKYG